MIVELDGGITRMQPQSVNWEPPGGLGQDGQGAPIYGPYWSCNLGFSYLTLAEFDLWFAAVDGATHTVRLPHPITAAATDFTCYVKYVTPRIDNTDVKGCRPGVMGADITLTRLQVT